MIDINQFLRIKPAGTPQGGRLRFARWLVLTGAAAIVGLANTGGVSPAFADSGETTGTFYSSDAPTGFEFSVPCDMDLKPSADSPEVKASCHLWDQFAPGTEPVSDLDLGLAANVNLLAPELVLPGQVDEEDETISTTTSAQTMCGEADGQAFCIMSAWTAGAAKVKGNKVSITRGSVGRLLIVRDDCSGNNCAAGGGPFSLQSDADAIADENTALRLVYPEADWVDWKFAINNEDIGNPGAFDVTLDDGLSASLVPNGAIMANATVAAAEIFSAIKTPGLYCSVNGVCIRF